MQRRGIDEIIAECEASGPASVKLVVENIRSEYPEIADHEIKAALERAIERKIKYFLAKNRKHEIGETGGPR